MSKRSGQSAKGAKSKLKRDRSKRGKSDQGEFGFGSRAGIFAKKPSSGSPSLRVYKPDPSLDVGKAFSRYGILDARSHAADLDGVGTQSVLNHVVCGDALEVLKRLDCESVACIVTSPPYWNVVDYGVDGQHGQSSYEDYLEALLGVWRECERVLRPNGKLCINTPIMPISKQVISDQHTRHLANLNNDIEARILTELPALHRYGLYIWQKQTTEKMFGSYPYPPNIYEQNTIEFINVMVKEGAPPRLPKAVKEASRLTEAEWMNLTKQVWRLYPDDVQRRCHPASFPVSLANRLIAMYTFRRVRKGTSVYAGDTVLDPFCGVGATCVAVKELGRNYVGIDLVPDFCVEAARRLEATTGNGKVALVDRNSTATKAAKPDASLLDGAESRD